MKGRKKSGAAAALIDYDCQQIVHSWPCFIPVPSLCRRYKPNMTGRTRRKYSWLLVLSILLRTFPSISAGDVGLPAGVGGGEGAQVVALAEQDGILPCDLLYPGGRPVPHIIEWSKRGHDVPIFILYQGYPPHIGQGYQHRLSIATPHLTSQRASLLIKKVQRQDEGWYECKVQLLNRPPETAKNGSWMYLLVHAPPQITSGSPWEMYVKHKEQVTLHCEASGTPRPKITWSKDGQVIRSTGRLMVTSSNSLTIRSVTTNDVGNYECSAKNAEGRVARITKLIIAAGAVILRPPENMTKLEGDRADLVCKAEGRPNNLTFHWSLNDKPIHSSYYSELSSRVVVQTDGTLIIQQTSKSDTGKYTCRVSNGIEETPQASAWLSIQYSARITYNPTVQYLPLNLSGIIRCFVEANPPVQFVQWTKDSRLFNVNATAGIVPLDNGSLFIEHVTMEQQGAYTCTPYNAHGTSGSSIEMNILVEEAPKFAVRPKQFYQGEVKGSVVMQCSAQAGKAGRPAPRVFWSKDDGTGMASDRCIQQADGSLTMVNLRKSDHGRYSCMVENEVATLSASTQLIIESTTPHAPTNLTLDIGPFSARLSWQPAYSGGFAQHYIIWYRHFGSSQRQWRTLRVRPDDATSFTVYNLSPDTLYEFQVLSRNQLGDGMFSEAITARTLDIDSFVTVFPTDGSGATYVPTIIKPSGPRPAAPTNVQVLSTTDGVRLQWEPAAVAGPSGANGNEAVPIMYYMVEYRQAGEEWGARSSGAIADGRTYFQPMDLQPSQTYEFRVYAFTLTSFSEPSQVQRYSLTGDLLGGHLSPNIAITAGVVGGVLFFAVSIILILVCARCNRRRPKRTGATLERYDSNGMQHRSVSPAALKRRFNLIKEDGLRSVRRFKSLLLLPQPPPLLSAAKRRAFHCCHIQAKSLSTLQGGKSGRVRRVSSGSSSAVMVATARPSLAVSLKSANSVVAAGGCSWPLYTMEGDYAVIPSGYLPFTPTRSDLDADCLDGSTPAHRDLLEATSYLAVPSSLGQEHRSPSRTVGQSPPSSTSQDSGMVTQSSSLDHVIDQQDFDSLLAHLQLALPKSRRQGRNIDNLHHHAQPWSSKEREERCKALLSEFRHYKRNYQQLQLALPYQQNAENVGKEEVTFALRTDC
ncbi:hypothetical protein RvY_18819 [Ramazzottius varieornatus]|uniref:Uncharacterized protein n=1 Tax=Ramazzottius varieornatus TaxID=947166 RepID=A0A1D1W744_RAMVA|nr:hypothetical protein RvY_18819 [Ramazzottius varieornatus]